MQLPDFAKVKVLVIGDLMLDRYWSGATGRISPEAPVPVVKVETSQDKPGGAANVALNCAALGAQVSLVGLCGQDEGAEILQQCLSSMGVGCYFVTSTQHETITKLRVLSRNQQLIRLDFEKSFSDAPQQKLLDAFSQQLDWADVVILSDYGKGTLSQCKDYIQLANQHQLPVVVDPKGSDFDKYAGATLLTPNMGEFEQIVGKCSDETELVSKAETLIEKQKLQALLVTRSEAGMTLIRPEKGELHLPAKAKEVFDVTGAGDTVISALAVMLGGKAPIEHACSFANAAASVVVGKLGTATVSVNEVLSVWLQNSCSDTGVMSKEQLLMAISNVKEKGDKVVMTNGCFDILHAGHVSYLQAAKKLGDRLIVAVNDDASVSRLKGAGRPINSLQRRMAVLAGLGSVDWVVPFSEDTPQALIASLLPDILVKGGDYRIEDIAGGAEVIRNGGDVKVLHFEDGVSTTNIIQQIVEHQD